MGHLLCGFSVFPLPTCSKCLEYISAKDIVLKIATDKFFQVFKEMALNQLQFVSLGPWLNLTGATEHLTGQQT